MSVQAKRRMTASLSGGCPEGVLVARNVGCNRALARIAPISAGQRGRGAMRSLRSLIAPYWSTRPASHLLAELVGDGIPPIPPEVAGGDLDAWRRLAALVLGEIQEPLHLLHRRRVVAASDNV